MTQLGPIPKLLSHQNAAYRVIVIGAGISGLACAWFLQQQGFAVTVLEASAYVGGNVQTVTRAGCQFERGPNTFINNRPAMDKLIEQIGLRSQIVRANAVANKRFVAKNGRLMSLPMSPMDAITTRIISWPAKCRALLEPCIGKAKREESIAQFVQRRLGKEILDWLVDPFVSGIFAGDSRQLSVRAAIPRLYGLECHHGSIMLGAIAKLRANRQRKHPKLDGDMMSFKQGLNQLIDTLSQQLASAPQLNTQVDGLSYSQKYGYRVSSGNQVWQTPQVVLAVPAKQVARLIDDLPVTNADVLQQAQEVLRSMHYPAVASITMAFNKSQIAHPMDGFGALIPSKENKQTLGVLFPVSIFSDRAPAHQHLLTAFIGGGKSTNHTDIQNTAVMHMNEQQRLQHVIRDLQNYLGISGQPLWSEESYWSNAIPQYHLGHLHKVALVDNAVAHLPGLYLRSNWRDGVGLGDCVEHAYALAKKITMNANRGGMHV